MNVLFFIDGSKDGYGSERVAVDIINNLSTKGVHFIVITTVEGYVRNYCKKNDVQSYKLKFYSYMYRKSNNRLVECLKRLLQIIYGFIVDHVCIGKIKKLININDIDLIYSNHSKNFIGGIISRKFNIPHIIHLHELYNGHYYVYPLLPNQTRWLNKHTDYFISCANLVGDNWIDSGIDRDKIINIYNGVDYNAIPVKKELSLDKLKMVMVASISKQKGQLLVLKSLLNIPECKRNNITIDFYGGSEDGEQEIIEQFIKKNRLLANIIGYDSNVKDKLCNYDIGINCSRAEACSMSILEYKAAGLAVIASRAGGTSEIIRDKTDGFLFDRNNINELSSCIEYLYDNRERITEIGKNSRISVERNFGVDRFFEKMYSTFVDVIG